MALAKIRPNGRKRTEPLDVYPLIFEKNIGAITREEQDRLNDSSAIVVGAGGIGGTVVELLARSGIGEITIVDKDTFELSNLNRQLLSTQKLLGKKKAEAAADRVKAINPNAVVHAVAEELTEKNAKKLLDGNQVVVDGLDNALSRVAVSRAAKELQMHYVFGACERARGYSTVFLPHGIEYERTFNLPSLGKRLTVEVKQVLEMSQRCDAILGVVSNLIGTFETMQTINLLLGKDVVSPPNFFHVNAFSAEPVRIGLL